MQYCIERDYQFHLTWKMLFGLQSLSRQRTGEVPADWTQSLCPYLHPLAVGGQHWLMLSHMMSQRARVTGRLGRAHASTIPLMTAQPGGCHVGKVDQPSELRPALIASGRAHQKFQQAKNVMLSEALAVLCRLFLLLEGHCLTPCTENA